MHASGIVAPVNAGAPARSSWSTAPSDQISARRSTGFPFACSGDMYAAVPSMTPACVAARLSVGEFERLLEPASALKAFGQTEIENLNLSVARELDVRGLQVAMNYPALVRVLDGFCNLPGHWQNFPNRNRPLSNTVRQSWTFHQFHNQRAIRPRLFQAMNGRNVGMIQ